MPRDASTPPLAFCCEKIFTRTVISLILTLEACKLDYGFKIPGFLVSRSNPTPSLLLSHIPEEISKVSNMDISFQNCLLCLAWASCFHLNSATLITAFLKPWQLLLYHSHLMAGAGVLGLIAVICCHPTENFNEVLSLTAVTFLTHGNCVSQIQCRILFTYTQYRE